MDMPYFTNFKHNSEAGASLDRQKGQRDWEAPPGTVVVSQLVRAFSSELCAMDGVLYNVGKFFGFQFWSLRSTGRQPGERRAEKASVALPDRTEPTREDLWAYVSLSALTVTFNFYTHFRRDILWNYNCNYSYNIIRQILILSIFVEQKLIFLVLR